VSTPFQIYVVATRPFAEKVAGGCVSASSFPSDQSDGTFWLDQESAEIVAENLNEDYGDGVWKVYPAQITIDREPIRGSQ